MWKRVVVLLLFCCLVTLFFCDSTDADLLINKTVSSNVWAATTLDFSNDDTANNQNTKSLFFTNGLLPGGFQVKSIRINNNGKMKFRYEFVAEKVGGDELLYKSLRIKLLKNFKVLFEGRVNDFAYTVDGFETKSDDWIMVLSLEDSDLNLSEKESVFNIVIKTTKREGEKFYVEQVLENRVETGLWKISD